MVRLQKQQKKNGRQQNAGEQNAQLQVLHGARTGKLALNPFLIPGKQMGQQQNQSKFCNLTHLNGGQTAHVDPPAAALDGRHEQHHHQKPQCYKIQRPGKPAQPVVIHPGDEQCRRQTHNCVKCLRAHIFITVAELVQ